MRLAICTGGASHMSNENHDVISARALWGLEVFGSPQNILLYRHLWDEFRYRLSRLFGRI